MKNNTFLKKLWWPLLVLVGLSVYGLALLFSVNQSVWFDEGYSILLAKGSWADLFSLTAVDAHPPLYYALLKIWGSVFGFGEFALRSMSAVFLAGASILGLLLVRKMFSTKVALYVIPFIIFAPFLIRYGYEIRMYSLALLIGVAATYVLIQARSTTGWWRWALYAALVALGMYTLYMTLVVWLAHVIWLLWASIKGGKPLAIRKWKWLYAYVLAVVLFIPYIATFIYQFVHSALPGVGNEITLTRLVDIVSMITTYTPEWQLGGWLSGILLAALILVGIVGTKVFKLLPKPERSYYLLLVLLVIVPIIFYAITSLPPREPIFINRYLAHVSLFMYILLGVTLALGLVYVAATRGRNRVLTVGTYGLALAVVLFGTFQLYSTGNLVYERLQHPQTSQLRQTISCNESTTIVADDPYTYIDSAFYFDGCDLRFYSQNDVERKGGYAPLAGSSARIAGPDQLTAPTVIRLGWGSNEPQFVPDARYKLVESKDFDKQRIDTFRLIEE